jgi:hypothetical protein
MIVEILLRCKNNHTFKFKMSNRLYVWILLGFLVVFFLILISMIFLKQKLFELINNIKNL